MTTLNEEILATERRVAREREDFARLLDAGEAQARDRVSSPSTLAMTAAAGYALGLMLRPSRSVAGRTMGLGGALAGAAWSLVRARYGSPWAIAQMILSRRKRNRFASPLDRRDPGWVSPPGGPRR